MFGVNTKEVSPFFKLGYVLLFVAVVGGGIYYGMNELSKNEKKKDKKKKDKKEGAASPRSASPTASSPNKKKN